MINLRNVLNSVVRPVKNNRGQTVIEYALIVVAIALATVTIMTSFKDTIGTAYTSVGTKLTTATE